MRWSSLLLISALLLYIPAPIAGEKKKEDSKQKQKDKDKKPEYPVWGGGVRGPRTCNHPVIDDRPNIPQRCPVLECPPWWPCIDECVKDSDCEDEDARCCGFAHPCGNQCHPRESIEVEYRSDEIIIHGLNDI